MFSSYKVRFLAEARNGIRMLEKTLDTFEQQSDDEPHTVDITFEGSYLEQKNAVRAVERLCEQLIISIRREEVPRA